jgi:hypothetical protein
METVLNTLSSGFSVDFDSITGKMTICRTTDFSLLLSTKKNLARLLGFIQQDYTGSASYTSSYIVNMRLVKNFFFFIEQIHTDISHCYSTMGSDLSQQFGLAKKIWEKLSILPQKTNKAIS